MPREYELCLCFNEHKEMSEQCQSVASRLTLTLCAILQKSRFTGFSPLHAVVLLRKNGQ